jgi:DNA mismatch repair ATPase MutS
MDEVCVSKKYFDIEIDENDNIKGDYKIRNGVSKKHLALKLLKNKGFDASIINDAEYMYEKLQGVKKEENKEKAVMKEEVVEDKVVIEEKAVVVEEVKDEKISK